MKFCRLVIEIPLTQNFCHPHTDRQTFPRNSEIVIGHIRTYKSIKNWKSKIFMKPILPSICAEESKNEKHTLLKNNNN